MNRPAKNMSPPRSSVNSWTPNRCQNLTVHDDHGKAFYNFGSDRNGTSFTLTPRRSERLRLIPEYPRERSISKQKRRNRKIKKDKSEKSVVEAESDDKSKINISGIGEITVVDSPVQIAPSPVQIAPLPVQIAPSSVQIAPSPVQIAPSPSMLRPATPLKSASTLYFSPKSKNLKSSEQSIKSVGKVTTRKRIPRTIVDTPKGGITKNADMKTVNSSLKLKQLPTPKSRIKMPNFKAIHKNQFEKMISIVDHVSLKQERAAKAFNFASVHIDNTPAKGNINSCLKSTRSTTAKKSVLVNHNGKSRKRIEISKIPIFKKDNDKPLPKVVVFQESSKPCVTRENIVNGRRKRNMASYKSGLQRAEKREIIQGVRSNRRFDLQMEYRNRLK